MSYAPDILLLQETRTQDAKAIAGHLNRLMKLNGNSCNEVGDRCYRIAISSNKYLIGETSSKTVTADTAILYNRRTMAFDPDNVGAFNTGYTQAQACVPKVDAAGNIVFVDQDFDGLNDCGKKRKIKRNFLAWLTERAPVAFEVAVASSIT